MNSNKRLFLTPPRRFTGRHSGPAVYRVPPFQSAVTAPPSLSPQSHIPSGPVTSVSGAARQLIAGGGGATAAPRVPRPARCGRPVALRFQPPRLQDSGTSEQLTSSSSWSPTDETTPAMERTRLSETGAVGMSDNLNPEQRRCEFNRPSEVLTAQQQVRQPTNRAPFSPDAQALPFGGVPARSTVAGSSEPIPHSFSSEILPTHPPGTRVVSPVFRPPTPTLS